MLASYRRARMDGYIRTLCVKIEVQDLYGREHNTPSCEIDCEIFPAGIELEPGTGRSITIKTKLSHELREEISKLLTNMAVRELEEHPADYEGKLPSRSAHGVEIRY